ncbi:hypothetical protein OG239_42695 (plasmid) [Streptomyces sp. NBC_00868]|uniref:hypothetical protein n=1 Tax=Streptomyces sp. NBC_00868 TaxID=2903683 RepID=UPI002F91956A|nr:hypothetical protein OG239_42695 [Streptomyces sp. NBC_00868]
MTTPREATPEPLYPSLVLITEEFERDVKMVEDRAAQFDTRGGVLIGFAGVLVGLIARTEQALALLQQWALGLAAGAAAAAAAGALWRQPTSTHLDPEHLRGYMATEEESARRTILDTQIPLYRLDQKRLKARMILIGLASALLMASLILLCLNACG